jgi:3-oxoadipate enol-lactonase
VGHIVIEGRKLVYERSGAGFPTLFLNGSGSTMEKARPLWTSFTRVAEVAVHDYRGLGSSEAGEPPTMAGFAADARCLADSFGWTAFDVVGVSFGGMVAQELAIAVGSRCRRLVLMCTSAGGSAGSSYPLHELLDLPVDERRRRMPQLSDRRFSPEYLSGHQDLRALIEASIEDREPTRGERAQMEARRLHDVTDRLHLITAETLVMAGEFDGIAPPVNGRRISERIEDSTYREYSGGHMFFVQDARAMVDVASFLVSGKEGLNP